MKSEKGDQAKKILFIPACEGVSHVGRMLRVAQVLKTRFDGVIEFAGKGKYGVLASNAGFRFHETRNGLSLREGRRFQERNQWKVSEIPRIYRKGYEVLCDVIDCELEIYREVRPDLIVWDGRFTVPISAEAAGVRYVSVINPALLPYSTLRRIVPKRTFVFSKFPGLLALTRLPREGEGWLAGFLWRLAYRFILRYYSRVRTRYGLRPFARVSDLLESLPSVILPDAEIMAPTARLPANFHYVGPLVWEPELNLPPVIDDLRDIIYITMGSTGSPEVFKRLVSVFSQLPELNAVITTGPLIDEKELHPLPENVRIFEYLPGGALAERAQLVICHGAPATMAQALSHGVPIIGIPFNIPQEMALSRVVSLGAGRSLLPTEMSSGRLLQVIHDVLSNDEYRSRARGLSSHLCLEDGPKRAAEIILKEVSQT